LKVLLGFIKVFVLSSVPFYTAKSAPEILYIKHHFDLGGIRILIVSTELFNFLSTLREGMKQNINNSRTFKKVAVWQIKTL